MAFRRPSIESSATYRTCGVAARAPPARRGTASRRPAANRLRNLANAKKTRQTRNTANASSTPATKKLSVRWGRGAAVRSCTPISSAAASKSSPIGWSNRAVARQACTANGSTRSGAACSRHRRSTR
jgi:hypothetical protein